MFKKRLSIAEQDNIGRITEIRSRTILKKVLLIGTVFFVAGLLYIDVSTDNLKAKVQKEVRQIVESSIDAPGEEIALEQLMGLPAPVRKYFEFVLKDGQEYIRTVSLKQTGEFRARESDGWVPLEAEQYYATKHPSFVWHARLNPTPYTWIEAHDVYHKGRGYMEGKLLSAFPIAFDSGKEMELSALARYLTEAPWYPTTLLPGKTLEWKALDSHSARAVLNDSGYTVSAVFTFSDNGEIVKVTTEDRYRNVNGRKERLTWTARYKNYQELNGVRIPTVVEAEWNLPKGNFTYAKIRIEEIKYQ